MSFLLAITFLTVIPLRGRKRGGGDAVRKGGRPPDVKGSAPLSDPSSAAVARAMLWFPVVGCLIGVAAIAVLLLAAEVLPGMLPEVVAVVFLVGLTGALHLDGLADTFDGVFGGRDRASRLRIMRDSAVGTFGLVAVVCALLLKVVALAALGERDWASHVALTGRGLWLIETFGRPRWAQMAVLALMPVWGRWVMTLSAGIGPYARAEGGTGAAFVKGTGLVESLLLGLIPLGLTGFLLGWPGVLAAGAATLAALLALLWWRARLGGVTGDTMGALGELVEVAFVLSALMLLPVGTSGPPF